MNGPSYYEMQRAYEREQIRLQQATPTCSACGERIVWIQMGLRQDGREGGTMPCDPEWRYGNGERSLVVLDDDLRGHLLIRPGEDVRGREPHWGTCVRRDAVRRLTRMRRVK